MTIEEKRKKYYLEHKDYFRQKQKKYRQTPEGKKENVLSVTKSRKKRVEKLRKEGCINAWSVVNNGKPKKYKGTENDNFITMIKWY